MAGQRVKCPRCKRTTTYITTDTYDPDKQPNGSMIKLRIKSHKGGLTYGSVRGSSRSVGMQHMECCDCGGMLCFAGRLLVVEDVVDTPELTHAEKNQMVIDAEFAEEAAKSEGKFVCSKCGRNDFKSKGGLVGHTRYCKGLIND